MNEFWILLNTLIGIVRIEWAGLIELIECGREELAAISPLKGGD